MCMLMETASMIYALYLETLPWNERLWTEAVEAVASSITCCEVESMTEEAHLLGDFIYLCNNWRIRMLPIDRAFILWFYQSRCKPALWYSVFRARFERASSGRLRDDGDVRCFQDRR